MAKPVVAVIEGDPAIAMLMDELLTSAGFQTHIWSEPKGASQFVRTLAPNLVILDVWLRERGDGWSVLEQLRHDRQSRTIPLIVCSGDIEMLQEQEAKLRAYDCEPLTKPFAVADLLALVKARTERSLPQIAHANHSPMESPRHLVAASGALPSPISGRGMPTSATQAADSRLTIGAGSTRTESVPSCCVHTLRGES